MEEPVTPKIAAIALDCQLGITSLLAATTGEGYCARNCLHPRDAEQIQDRFNQWAGNLGALQSFSSPQSLEHRLRDAQLVRESILKSLTDLHMSIQAATDIALGKRQNRVTRPSIVGIDSDLSEYDLSSSESDSSSLSSLSGRNALASTSELQELMSAIRAGLDSLFKASIFIRKFSSEDKRLRAAKTEPFDSRADIMYINDRYPLLNKFPALVARLGEANARRRQYFKYRRDHHERLSTVTIKHDPENVIAQAYPVVRRSGLAKSVLTAETKPSLLAETEATAFMAEAAQARMLETPAALEVMPAFSFATSVAENSDEELAFPPVPAEADNGSPFLCPYCFRSQQFERENSDAQWRKHVLGDLEPYICTSPTCSLDTFQSQHTWFGHELLLHRSQWICSLCSISCSSPDRLKDHVSQHHNRHIPDRQLSAFIDQSKRPIDCVKPSECPFCDDSWAQADSSLASNEDVFVVNLDQFRRHLGQHLQQVALFSLPRLIHDHDQSLRRHDDSRVPDLDSIPEGYRWIRDDCSYGWSIVSRRRATIIALALFLEMCPTQETYALPVISYHGGSYKGRSYHGSKDLIQLLIDQGAAVGAGQEQYNEALQAAAYGGYEEMIQPLLDNGAEINAQGGKYGNSLQAANYGGHDHIVRQLLDKGGDPRSLHSTDKALITYVGYTLVKHPVEHVGQKETRAIVDKLLMPVSQFDLKTIAEKHRRKGVTGLDQYNDPDMKGFERKQIDELIRECVALDPDHRFEYIIASIKRDSRRRKGGVETSAMQVILQRQPRPGIIMHGPFSDIRLPMSNVVDLSGAEDSMSSRKVKSDPLPNIGLDGRYPGAYPFERRLSDPWSLFVQGVEYASIIVTASKTNHSLLLRLSDSIGRLKQRVIQEIPSVMDTLAADSTRSVQLMFHGKVLDNESLSCMQEGLKHNSHVFCLLED